MYATPRRPARAVLPTLCTYVFRCVGASYDITAPTRSTSSPRVAASDAISTARRSAANARSAGARGSRRERAVLGEDGRGATARFRVFVSLVPLPLRGVHGREQQEQPVRRLHGRGEHDHGRVRLSQQRAQRERLRVARSDGHHRLDQPLGQEVPRALGRRRLGVRRGGEHARRVKEQPGESRGVPRERRGDEDLLQPAARGASSPTAGPRRRAAAALPSPAASSSGTTAAGCGPPSTTRYEAGPGRCATRFRAGTRRGDRGCHQHVELIVRVELIGPVVEGGLGRSPRRRRLRVSARTRDRPRLSGRPPGRGARTLAPPGTPGRRWARRRAHEASSWSSDPLSPGPGEARTPESCRCPSARTRTSLGRTSSRRRCVATPQIARRTSWTHPERAGWPSIFHPSPAPHRVRPDAPTGTTSAVASIVKPVASSARIGMCGFF